MTEEQWLACGESERMLGCLGGEASDRKLRLFAVAVHRARPRGPTQTGQREAERAAKLAERIAEGAPSGAAGRFDGVYFVLFSTGFDAASRLAGHPALPDRCKCALLRDVFGNPFRPMTFSPAWRTDTALLLARQTYEARGFSPMPILADALQDAGCDSEDVLSHCRDAGAARPRVSGR